MNVCLRNQVSILLPWEFTVAKKLPRSPYLNPAFSAAVKEFGIELIKTSAIKHRGNKGSEREKVLRDFFTERLPNRFAVTEGEIVDLYGNTSPQMDLIFYDQGVDFALNSGSTSILPAEAVLATIEVKSALNSTEVCSCVSAAKKLRNLKPHGKKLAGKDIGNSESRKARYLHCVFAYDSDIQCSNWLNSEGARFIAQCNGEHLIDSVYVVDRGIINIKDKIGRVEDDEGGAITNFYFSVLNFLQREAGRRKETPFERYTKSATAAWKKL